MTTGTSGAAELFVAALDGNERADVVGERTLGRAGIQKLVQLPENRGLWLTYAKYLTPKGDPIHGKGIEPDVRVEEPDVEFGSHGAREGRDARHRGRSSPQESRLTSHRHRTGSADRCQPTIVIDTLLSASV